MTPYAKLANWLFSNDRKEFPEESPAAALLLHWVFAVILIGATSTKPPSVAYAILIELYTYTLVVMVGFAVATGIILIQWCKLGEWKEAQREWKETSDFTSWGSPAAAIYYA